MDLRWSVIDALAVAQGKTGSARGMAGSRTGGDERRALEGESDQRVATVLVVDDDPAIRRLVASMLDLGGYRPLCAASGEEALSVLKSPETSADLVVTDLAMPGISGLELARQIRTRHPALPVVFMTGVVEDGPAETLRKPFTVTAFLTFVRAALGRER